VNSNVVPAQPGWVVVEAGTGGEYPVVAWLPMDVMLEGPTVNRSQQLWPMARVDGDQVPCALSPDRMERGNMRIEYWPGGAP
jgi:hypothetical protein